LPYSFSKQFTFLPQLGCLLFLECSRQLSNVEEF
jgi:hypothetical protein